ncbi:MAG: ShlB/FhaC/HecB family hemolysin secretion/activation protein [Rariglobus sp.]
MRSLSARGSRFIPFSTSTRRNAVTCALMVALAASASAQSSPSDPVQRPAAQSAFSDTISAPIAPSAVPAPVKIEDSLTQTQTAPATSSDDVRLVIQGVRFSGNTIFTSEELSALVAADLGKPLSFSELQAFATRVENHYHSKGYLLTRVIIPQQDIGAQRVLEFRVLEGWLESISVQGSRRFSEDRIRRTLLDEIRVGEPFKVADMERALVRLNKVAGLRQVGSTLKAGDTAGATQLQVEVQEERRATGSVEVNNFGSKNTGEYRIIPAVSLPNLSGRGDTLGIFGVISPEVSDLYFAQVNYTTPLNVRGTAASAYYSQGNYQVGREFAVLEIEGDNRSWGAGLSQDQILSAKTSLNYELWLESSDLEQTMLGVVTSRDEIRKVRLGANLDQKDLRGRTFASFHIHQGLGEALGGMDNDSPLSSRSFGGADNSFTKFSGTVTRLQSLHARLYLLAHLSAQYAVDSIVASEQIAIGGANSVRGHAQSAFAGDDGFVFNLEARYAILPDDNRYQAAVFFDHGQVQTKEPIIGQDRWERLSGAGVGARVTVLNDLELRVDLAAPIGTKTDDDFYVYAQARYRF